MPHQIVITDDDIRYAETILLSQGETFDAERIAFIKNLNTTDLQACPGSGKTTCLLAKLLILGKYFPISNNGGILVLSHTNAAINEIKNKLSKYTPELFQYPNFVGTIQSFVDYFLAIPFYVQKFGHQPNRIDNEIFNEKIWEPGNAKGWLNKQLDKTEFLRNLRFDINDNLISGIEGEANKFRLTNKNSTTYKALYEMRSKLMEEGYLCFDDAYCLGELYLKYFPKISDLIRLRFTFIFIDEMQDTDNHQVNILDRVFPDGCQSVVQRIGDQNQAIYSGRVKSDTVWIPRQGYLTLNGSKRLSEYISQTVKNISIYPQNLVGNSTRINIKPQMLLFDDKTIKKVLPKFAEIIIKNNLHIKKNAIFKAVGWRKDISDEKNKGKGIISYFDNFQVKFQKNQTDFNCLEDYINHSPEEIEDKGLVVLFQGVLNVINKVLRISGINSQKNKFFNSKSLLLFLREKQSEEYELLKLKLFSWSLNIINGFNVKDQISAYVKHLLKDIFFISELSEDAKSFLTDSAILPSNLISPSKKSITTNKFYYKKSEIEINIEVTTIHSVKGETHTGTLYLETFYYKDSGKSYESQRLLEQLKGNRSVGTVGKRVQESQKMAYVGMTRPTDLLCLAVHKLNIPNNEINNLKSLWDIIDLTN